MADEKPKDYQQTKKKSDKLDAEKYEDLLSNFAKKQNSEDVVEELNTVMDQFYVKEFNNRQKVL